MPSTTQMSLMSRYHSIYRVHSFAQAGAVLLFAFIACPPVSAENQTNIEKLKIEVDYDACTIEKTQKNEFCANEKLSIDVNADGWAAKGTGTDGAPPVLEMNATCQDGKYKSITNGQPAWRARCELTGDAARPCFHISGGGSKEAFTKVETLQCFDIAESACTMTIEGVMIGQAESVKGEYMIAVKKLKSCRIME